VVTNVNSENGRRRMEASCKGKCEYGDKEDESTTGRVWAAGFYHVTARSRLGSVLNLMYRLFL
jgi:hypothetical protein